MVMRERVTVAVVFVLIGFAIWFGSVVASRGLGAETGGELIIAVVGITLLTSIGAALAAGLGGARAARVDERDRRVALQSQTIRGFFYLLITFGLAALAFRDGNFVLVNTLFLAILCVEIISGVIMLVLYRNTA